VSGNVKLAGKVNIMPLGGAALPTTPEKFEEIIAVTGPASKISGTLTIGTAPALGAGLMWELELKEKVDLVVKKK
jgi:hypothetical protein